MNSLRRRLVLSLWAVLLLIGLASAGFAYLQARSQTNTLLDYQMGEIAGFVAGSMKSTPGPVIVTPKIDLSHEDEDDFLVTVRDAQHAILFASIVDMPLPDVDWQGYRTQQIAGKEYRVFSAATADGQRIVVAQQTVTQEEVAADAALTAVLPIALLIPILGLAIYWLIGNQLGTIRQTAREVSGRSPFDASPLAIEGVPSEVLPLINEINRLLFRQRGAVEREQMFLADAAHALRTPLAALQLQFDILEGSSDAAENDQRRHELRRGILRATRLNDHLLALARGKQIADANSGRVDLDAAIIEIFDFYRPLAEARSITLLLDAVSGASVRGDSRLLMLLVGNLLDNAIRYTPPQGQISLSTSRHGGLARIDVLDEGPGLPQNELESVFERFRRGAHDETPGTGLGLAVVLSVAEQLGGTAWLEHAENGRGLRAIVELPSHEA